MTLALSAAELHLYLWDGTDQSSTGNVNVLFMNNSSTHGYG